MLVTCLLTAHSPRVHSACPAVCEGSWVSSLPVLVLAVRTPPRPGGAADGARRSAGRARRALGKVTAACPYFSDGRQAYVESDSHSAPASVKLGTKKGNRPCNKPFGQFFEFVCVYI